MQKEVVTTSIRGNVYQTQAFDFDESVSIQLELGQIIGGAAGPFVEFASQLFTYGDDGAMHFDEEKANAADTSVLNKVIQSIPQGIIAAGGVKFVRRILANTSREVESIVGDGRLDLVKLSDHHPSGGQWFDYLFTGGNLLELYLAIGWVLTVNFSPFGRGGSWGWKQLFIELQNAIPTLSTLSIGIQRPSSDLTTAKTKPEG